MKLYVASSWRCVAQPAIVCLLRNAGHQVYDFRNPRPDDYGFHWSHISPDWKQWDFETYRAALKNPIAQEGFNADYGAMKWADACVLVLPCGRSAHLEAGWFIGAGKPLFILLLGDLEPELMYKMATHICLSPEELLLRLADHG